MPMVRMDIETIVVGGGPVASLIVLHPRDPSGFDALVQLPIRIGMTEASAIGMGVDGTKHDRPMTHDLLRDVISALGASVTSISIVGVEGTTFYAKVDLATASGEHVSVDSRPSDAIALAVRTKAPLYASENVLATASCPDFKAVEKDEESRELAEFHEFVENLSPEDFDMPSQAGAGSKGEADAE